MELKQLNEKLSELGRDWEEFKSTNDARLAEIEKGGGTAELQEKLDKIDENVKSITKAKQDFEVSQAEDRKRIEELEAALDRQGPGGTSAHEKNATEYHEKFIEWMRTANDASDNQNKLANELRSLEAKDVNIGTGAQGGFAVPEIIARDIHKQAQLWSPIRQDCRVVSVGSSDYKELVDLYGATSGWVGETDTRSATGTPLLRERTPTFGTAYCYPAATEESVQDIFFDVGSWLVEHASFELARVEGIAALTGNGTNKPTGLLNTAPTSDTDSASPARNAEALEYVPMLAGSPAALSGDGLIDIVYRLRSEYRVNATWGMNSLTTGAIRKLKDGNDNYLWAPGLAAGQPNMLLGYAQRTYEDLADLATNSLSVTFGDMRRGYLLVDRGGLRMTVDDNLTAPGYVKFYIRRRVGGILLDNNAVKVGKYSAS